MAYRKTPQIIAEIESRRAAIVAATEDIVLKLGIAGLTTDLVASRAKISVGLIYKHFPDKAELIPAMVGNALARDMEAFNHAIMGVPPPATLVRAVAVIYYRMKGPHLNAALLSSPIYRNTLSEALARIVPVDPPALAKIASAAILGATRGIWEAVDGAPRGARHSVIAAFRIAGLTETAASRMMERYSLA